MICVQIRVFSCLQTVAINYDATPDLTTTRLMQALMVRFGWTPMAFDIKMAYINADIPEDEQVPIQFEKSLRHYDKNGNELFKLLQKCL